MKTEGLLGWGLLEEMSQKKKTVPAIRSQLEKHLFTGNYEFKNNRIQLYPFQSCPRNPLKLTK